TSSGKPGGCGVRVRCLGNRDEQLYQELGGNSPEPCNFLQCNQPVTDGLDRTAANDPSAARPLRTAPGMPGTTRLDSEPATRKSRSRDSMVSRPCSPWMG